MMTVFGIPMFATHQWSAAKLNHVASILAELIDNDNDGCADDLAALNTILASQDGKRVAALLPNNEAEAEWAEPILEAAGKDETIPTVTFLLFQS